MLTCNRLISNSILKTAPLLQILFPRIQTKGADSHFLNDSLHPSKYVKSLNGKIHTSIRFTGFDWLMQTYFIESHFLNLNSHSHFPEIGLFLQIYLDFQSKLKLYQTKRLYNQLLMARLSQKALLIHPQRPFSLQADQNINHEFLKGIAGHIISKPPAKFCIQAHIWKILWKIWL